MIQALREVCPICLEIIIGEASITHPCQHRFCLECITKWTDNNSTCPLCLKHINSISKRSITEDLKEETCHLKISANKGKNLQEEEFECLDHNYFVHEFRCLFKQAKDSEFTLKSQLGIGKKAVQIEKNYQLVLHLKQEIEMKLNYLARTYKISPKDLLGDIQHFSDVIRKLDYSNSTIHYDEFAYLDDTHYEDDYYYDGNEGENGNSAKFKQLKNIDGYPLHTFTVSKNPKKKNKNKMKNKKGKTGSGNNNTTLTQKS